MEERIYTKQEVEILITLAYIKGKTDVLASFNEEADKQLDFYQDDPVIKRNGKS